MWVVSPAPRTRRSSRYYVELPVNEEQGLSKGCLPLLASNLWFHGPWIPLPAGADMPLWVVFLVIPSHTRDTWPLRSGRRCLSSDSMGALSLPSHAQCTRSMPSRHLYKLKKVQTYVSFRKGTLFPPVLSLQCSCHNLLTSGTTQRVKPLPEIWISTQRVNNSLERSLELHLPIYPYWKTNRVLGVYVKEHHLWNLLRICQQQDWCWNWYENILSSLIAILEFCSDQHLQRRGRFMKNHVLQWQNTTPQSSVCASFLSLSSSSRLSDVRTQWADTCEALTCLRHRKHSISIISCCSNISDINIRHWFFICNLHMIQRIFFLCMGIIFSFSPWRQEISSLNFYVGRINRFFLFFFFFLPWEKQTVEWSFHRLVWYPWASSLLGCLTDSCVALVMWQSTQALFGPGPVSHSHFRK